MDGADLDPTKYGWRLIDGQLEPIATLLPVAPSSLLKLSKCPCGPVKQVVPVAGSPVLRGMPSVLGTVDVMLASVKIITF